MIVWPPHLIPRDGQMFVRQQWIWNNEIQNRIFVVAEPDKAAKYIATIKVSKAVGSAEKEVCKLFIISQMGFSFIYLSFINFFSFHRL